MSTQLTLSIIKPDAVAGNKIGGILQKIENAGLEIVATKMLQLSEQEAGAFYEVHKERPFYPELVKFMTSNPVVVSVLRGENAVAKYRELMGATDPAEAAQGTIRAEFATSKGENAVHGSDSAENAAREIAFFFAEREICGRG